MPRGLFLVLFSCLFLINVIFGQRILGFSPAAAQQERQIEAQFLKLPFAGNNRQYLFKLTEEPHVAGTQNNKKVAEYILSKYREWGWDAQLVEYKAYLSYPESIEVKLVEPQQHEIDFTETASIRDKDAFDNDVIRPFNAYSPSGDITAQVVYVNRGLPEDYKALDKLGINVRGKIALVRYGGSFRGVKAKVAEEHGAAGLIIYSDPADDGYMRGDIYPNGPMRPWKALQRGSLMYIFYYPGDPLSPGFPSLPGRKLLPPEKAGNVPHIPTVPISYGEAQYILESLAGPEVPDRSWQGGLPFRYHVGPGPAKVHLQLTMKFQIRSIYDIIATLPGKRYPEKKVILGNHFDAWTYGAVDPNSGTAVVMEMARALGALKKTGWQPDRTIVIAHWDGEEYGLIGSTEWVEQYKDDLKKNGVLYLNIDSGVSGENFSASAVPSLDRFIQAVVKEFPDPNTQLTVFQKWWKNQNKKLFEKLGEVVPDSARARIGRLGSGSDYTAFLDHIGVSSLSMGFGGRYGVYHSILDNFYWMSHWGDPSFKYHETLSKIAGVMVLRIANATVLPFNYEDYARAIFQHASDLEKRWKEEFSEVPVDLTPLKGKLQKWMNLSGQLNEKIKQHLEQGNVPAALNENLVEMERLLTYQPGLPNREWFKHRIYAPGFYTGYASKPLPGLAEPAERKDWDTVVRELKILESLIDQVIAKTEDSLGIL